MIGLNRFRILLSVLPVAALLACSEQEPVGPAAAAPEENELAVSAYATTWKIADYWCMDFDGDRGTMKLKMGVSSEMGYAFYNSVSGTVDWKRRADATLKMGQLEKPKSPANFQKFGENFTFWLKVGEVISSRKFRAYRKDGNACLLKGDSWDPTNGTRANIKPWFATRGACK